MKLIELDDARRIGRKLSRWWGLGRSDHFNGRDRGRALFTSYPDKLQSRVRARVCSQSEMQQACSCVYLQPLRCFSILVDHRLLL